MKSTFGGIMVIVPVELVVWVIVAFVAEIMISPPFVRLAVNVVDLPGPVIIEPRLSSLTSQITSKSATKPLVKLNPTA